jgi:large subunit ribosomal protein L21
MYAIIDDRGRQHFVEQGKKILIDLHEAEPGSTIEFDRVLMIGGVDAGASIGRPTVAGAKVTAVVARRLKMPKIHVLTYKRRKNFKRKVGHRQQMTEIEIQSIQA